MRWSRDRRGLALDLGLALTAIAVPVIAYLTAPASTHRPADLASLPSVRGTVKLVDDRRVVIEQVDGMFRTLDAHLLDDRTGQRLDTRARYGRPVRVWYRRTRTADVAVWQADDRQFPGVSRTAAHPVSVAAAHRLSLGAAARTLWNELGPPQEVRFEIFDDQPADCWYWPVQGAENHRITVCFDTSSRPRSLGGRRN